MVIRKSFEKIETPHAPKAIGPYSQAIVTEELVFVSGQIPLNPVSGTIEETSIAGQTKQVLDNLEAILQAAGLGFEDVVKTEVFLQDMDDFLSMNVVYSKRFKMDVKPARQAVEVAALPMNALIEISCIAVRSKM